jgi:hypothetical protein
MIVSTLEMVLTDSDEQWLAAVYSQTRSSLDMRPAPLPSPHHRYCFAPPPSSIPRIAILEGALPKPITPFLIPCTCVQSAHLTHGINRCPIYWLTLPNGTDKGRFYRSERRGERSIGLSVRLLLRGRNRAGGVA